MKVAGKRFIGVIVYKEMGEKESIRGIDKRFIQQNPTNFALFVYRQQRNYMYFKTVPTIYLKDYILLIKVSQTICSPLRPIQLLLYW